MFECIGCPTLEFESKPDLEAHVAAIHFNYLPYECEKCRFAKFPTEYAIRYHWEFEHQITEYCIRYRVSPELISKREEISDYVQRCVTGQITIPSQNADYDNEALEEKPNLESTITETNGNFPSTSISPVLKQLLENAEISANTSLGGTSNNKISKNITVKSSNRKSKIVASDALRQMKRKRKTESIEPTPSSSAASSSTEPTTSSSPVMNSATVECTECKRIIANQATSVMYHTNSRHLQLPVFSCTPCKRIWTTISRSDLLKHVKNFHNNDMSVIVDKKDEYIIKIKEKCRELFPNRGSMVSKRKCYDKSVADEDAAETEQE
uniref:C2H2-type domain-containing protein n=1 Tax=Panagrolaimus sp. ES5 TaxID=591445 RepID=A0AC34FFZ5_9BILA